MEDRTMLARKMNGYLPSIYDSFFNNGSWMEKSNFTDPDYNLYETDKDFVIETAVPGVSKESFNIEVNDNVLSISCEQKTGKTADDKKYHCKSFCYGSFKSSYTLPDNVDKESIAASYENGILKVIVPKNDVTKISKQITIS